MSATTPGGKGKRSGAKEKAKTKGKAKATKATLATESKPEVVKPGGSSAWLGVDVNNGFFLLASIVAVLCAFGAMMVLSASSVNALANYDNSWFFFRRQLLWLLVGAVVMFVMVKIRYQTWRRWSGVLVAIAAGLLLLVLIPGIGHVVGGSRRWIGPGMFRFQPSELAKLALLVYGADLFARRSHLMNNWRATLQPFGMVFGFFAILIYLQPDLDTTFILGGIAVTMAWVAGSPGKYLFRILSVAIGGATILAIVEPYRRERLTSFMDPFADAGNTGYQMVQSLVGIGSGGIFGVGLGASKAKWGFLPNAHNDFIFAIIAEELGLIGATAVILLFIGFAVLGIRAATRAPDRFGMLLAAGITVWVVSQAFLNIGAVVGILPVTGVPLPFISQGGTALVVLMAATGILLNISRQGEGGAAGTAMPDPATVRNSMRSGR